MRTWLSVTVELLGGRGETFWPPPGRVFVVGPRHTFGDLAEAVNAAFGRWDLSHLSVFRLPDGTVVSDEETVAEEMSSPIAPPPAGLDMTTATVAKNVQPGRSFRYEFDLGEGWTHACTVTEEKVDPVEVYGILPKRPTPYFGWGAIPDQYGREWRSDLAEDLPPRTEEHPMLAPGWPAVPESPLDVREMRGAARRREADTVLELLRGADLSPALQQVGQALEILLQAGDERAEHLAARVVQLLQARGWEGDMELAEDLLALLRGQELPGRPLTVDLENLADQLEGPVDEEDGYLDLRTGEVVPGVLTDAAEVGEDAAVDVEDDPDRWLVIDTLGSHEGWQDMSLFAAGVTDARLRATLESALSGRGAFRRFKDAVHESGVAPQWYTFSTERQLGRARDFLAANGIRVLP